MTAQAARAGCESELCFIISMTISEMPHSEVVEVEDDDEGGFVRLLVAMMALPSQF